MHYIKQLQLIVTLLVTIVVLSLVTGVAFFTLYKPGAPVQAAKTDSPQPQTLVAQIAAITDPEAKAGEEIFKNNCVACHSASTEVVVGPGLAGITQRRTVEWLIPWIKNSQKVIASGDKYAVELYNKYNKTVMPSYDFTNEQVKSILKYINTVNGATAVAQQ